ncbi:STAS domain-containing protein [Jiangella ureilytica]|uniref:STAS domain-containing protein n=1 Tax=Jiangella ureilytica TaxID=2530374 RepID=UPI0013A5C8DC|nr:STAS domain-containing protein [Jiangella ureilytica]
MIVRLSGTFEAADLAAFAPALAGLVAADHVVVELSRARLPAPAVLRALTAAHAEAERHGTSVHVTGAGRALRRLLRRQAEDRPAYHEHLADAVEAALTARDARAGRRS